MSNPAVYLLASTTIQGKALRIEDNLGEAIHVHIGDLRVSLSIYEFENFCASVLEAAKYLFELKGLDWDLVDLSSLDWEWLADYSQLKSMQVKEYKICELYTVRNLFNSVDLQQIVPVKKSIFYQALEGKHENLLKYKEINMYSQDNFNRLNGVLDLIKQYGYPYNEKYIMVDSAGRIYDGDHRAACLCYLKGEEYKIPVLELAFDNQEQNIETEIRNNQLALVKKILKRSFHYILMTVLRLLSMVKSMLMFGFKKKNRRKKVVEVQQIDSFDALLEKFKEKEVPYYVIDHPMRNGNLIPLATIIVSKDSFLRVSDMLSDMCISDCDYKSYSFLYSTPVPQFISINGNTYAIWDRICCKSKFENAILPVDKFCDMKSWESIYKNEKGFYCASVETCLLQIILNAILEKNQFDEKDISYIENKKAYLNSVDFGDMIEKEFFKYSKELLALLREGKYNEVVAGYVTNVEY